MSSAMQGCASSGVGAKFLDAVPTQFAEQRLKIPPDAFKISLMTMLGINVGGSVDATLFNRLKCDCTRKSDMGTIICTIATLAPRRVSRRRYIIP